MACLLGEQYSTTRAIDRKDHTVEPKPQKG
jgi:hypothetical protein